MENSCLTELAVECCKGNDAVLALDACQSLKQRVATLQEKLAQALLGADDLAKGPDLLFARVHIVAQFAEFFDILDAGIASEVENLHGLA